jgi:hypothetical protein
MHWTTTGGAAMTWLVGGITAYPAQAPGQVGVLLGLTASTNADDMAILSLVLQPEVVAYRG